MLLLRQGLDFFNKGRLVFSLVLKNLVERPGLLLQSRDLVVHVEYLV